MRESQINNIHLGFKQKETGIREAATEEARSAYTPGAQIKETNAINNIKQIIKRLFIFCLVLQKYRVNHYTEEEIAGATKGRAVSGEVSVNLSPFIFSVSFYVTVSSAFAL